MSKTAPTWATTRFIKICRASSARATRRPALAGVFSMFTVNVPQLDADVDREKAKTQGVPLQNLFETLQIYLGSLYVNDFNRFGRTYEVIAQADSQFRAHAEDITRLKTRNDKGEMVPLGAIVKVTETHGPDRVMRYNGYPAAEINGGPRPVTVPARPKRRCQNSRKKTCRAA
jgi:multidrug efflux pump subunit AcrB